jgi:hypothetical protein
MRTLTLKIYKFSELTKEAKENAIENVQKIYDEYNDFAEQSIDNCYLFEPPHEELIKLFGENFYNDLNKNSKYKDTPLIGNTREEINFDVDRKYLNCQKALNVKNSDYFLKWLGLNGALIEKIRYDFTNLFYDSSTEIQFEPLEDIVLTEDEYRVLDIANYKFRKHIEKVLENIKKMIEWNYTDEAIEEDIEANDYEFLEDGTIYK